MYLLYSLALAALALAYLPVFLWRKVWRARHPLALGERFGFVPLGPGPGRFWVHAVSVGEVVAAVPLVRALRQRWPDTEIVISTVTATGAEMARARLPEAAAAFVFPLDFAHATRRVIRRVRPRCFIALETELWPNLLRSLAEGRIPSVLANGRISDRSYRRYARVRRLFARVLRHGTLFLMQSEEDARRIRSLGAPAGRVVVTGNLKLEVTAPGDGAGDAWRQTLGLGVDCVWVAGSTHRGEEVAVLDAFVSLRAASRPLRLVLAPRHPERVAEVEALARARGLRAARRTRIDADAPGDVVLLDTVGELASVYAAADVVFVGGSLVPIGGHNVIEAARHAKPVLFGPHMGNFREAALLLLDARGAIQLRHAAELEPTVRALLEDPPRRLALGQAARGALDRHQEACGRTLRALEALLEGADVLPRSP